jgi:hypothetical protein
MSRDRCPLCHGIRYPCAYPAPTEKPLVSAAVIPNGSRTSLASGLRRNPQGSDEDGHRQGTPSIDRRHPVQLMSSTGSAALAGRRPNSNGLMLLHMERVGRFSLGVIVAGVAVITGFAAMTITLVVIGLSGNIWVLTQACSGSAGGRQVCTPYSLWAWAFPAAGVVGAAAGAIGAHLFWRNRVRPPTPTIFD